MSASTRHLTVVLAGTAYGVAVPRIRDILRIQKAKPLEGFDPSVKGAIELRSHPVLVADLRTRLGVEAAPALHPCLLVVELTVAGAPPVLAGLIVDTIGEVFCVGECDLITCPDLVAPAAGVAGECRIKGRQKRILDVDQLYPAEVLTAFLKQTTSVPG